MKNKKKHVMFLCFFLMLLLTFSADASAGFRKMHNGKYRYYVTSKQYLKGKKQGNTRIAAFKNLKSKGKTYTYAFDEKGYMLTGWQILYTKEKNGTYAACCYYFNKNGQMMKNRSKGGCYFLGNGRMVNGCDKYGNYYGMDGIQTSAPASSAKFVKNKKGIRYQISKGEYAVKTWLCIRDKTSRKAYWYYFKSNGYMAKNTYIGTHYVDKKGHWIPAKDKKNI